MNIHNIAIVRVINAIPFDGIMYPISEVPYLQREANTAFAHAVYDMLMRNSILREVDWSKSEEEQEKDSKYNNAILKQYLPYSSMYNSMLLWSLNGIVPDDMNNTFSTKHCAIIDGLEEQINSDIISLTPTDTAIKGKIKLSQNAVILISKQMYETLSEEEKQRLSNLRIRIKVFDGGIKEAIDIELSESKRYTAETLSLHREDRGFVESDTSEELIKTISNIASEKNIPQELHWNIFLGKHEFSEKLNSVQEEYKNARIVVEHYKQNFFIYLFSKLDIDRTLRAQAIACPETGEYMKNLCIEIEKIGIDKYKEIVSEYNMKLELLREKKLLPSPQQIVESIRKNMVIDLNSLIKGLSEINDSHYSEKTDVMIDSTSEDDLEDTCNKGRIK